MMTSTIAPIKRPDAITQAWWASIATQCEHFFDLSKAFYIGDDPDKLDQILSEMTAIYEQINALDCPLQLHQVCADLPNAMQSLLESLTQLSRHHHRDSVRLLHRALYDLQRFHIALDELNLRYKPRRIRDNGGIHSD